MKNKRVEFRAGEDEIQTYKDIASKEGISVSEWLRNAAYRAAEHATYENMSAGNVPESVEYIEEVAAATLPTAVIVEPAKYQQPGSVVHPKAFKQLVAQLQSRMSLEDAEDEARKRLGMD